MLYVMYQTAILNDDWLIYISCGLMINISCGLTSVKPTCSCIVS